MFPWSPEFRWDAGHLAFFGALYAVLAVIATSLLVAARRAQRNLARGRVAGYAWRVEFEELPASVRACRHQLTGEAPDRVCENAFDCRSCRKHPQLDALRSPHTSSLSSNGGFDPRFRLYHRGHSWARLERNGAVTVGLDGIARRLLGPEGEVELPAPGSRLETHGELARAKAHGVRVRLLSPVSGTVTGVRGTGANFKLKVAPDATLDVRHLLVGREAKVWSLRELERVERALDTPVALADGGELVADLGAVLPRDRYERLIAEVFLAGE